MPPNQIEVYLPRVEYVIAGGHDVVFGETLLVHMTSGQVIQVNASSWHGEKNNPTWARVPGVALMR